MSENNNKVTSPPDQTEGLQHAGRRQFLRTLATGGAVAGIAAVTASQAMAATTPEVGVKPAPEEKSGYRETDHIRTFYDTLR
ncbi:twin-arginine translocation signal domain-containing protein [Oceanospirillum sanctuarii]|uniref:twin-arginine translocation signal domain-containing protein n=1 Tax=Oceanospirillum sanctuarii TaxID=1434821 RepID=UPI000A3A7F58|nr:twin-arginine translocation signal domain-containing protein [Oceanospirillum sanctuarii]